MAKYIYDKDGKLIGTSMTEEEKNIKNGEEFAETIGCLGALICGIVGFIFICPWLAGILMLVYEGEMVYLYPMIPITIATIVAGRKFTAVDAYSPWGVFWRVLLIDTVFGTPGGILATLADLRYYDTAEVVVGAIFSAAWFAVFPAAIVAWIVRGKKKKRR